MKLTPDNAIALIVDLQEKLVPAMDDAPRLVARSKYLLEGLSVLQIPVVQTRQYPKGLGDTLAEIQEAAPSAKYFDKTTFGCLETKEIRDFFVADSRPNVLLAGIETHICVLQTALELLELGKRVYLIADCSTSRSPFDAQIAQERAFQAGVVPATAEAILFETTRDAGSPYFKAISKLTKELK
ncbi:MAG: isochorismatase family protein [Thermoguttaceae bacterium]|nr:isochorismatase family protein [Thermoguttaceae bacterium]